MSTGSEPFTPTGGEFTATPPKPKGYVSTAPLSADDLITLNEEIASMAKAGLPLDKGLELLAREMGGGRLQSVTQQLADDMRGGATLPDAVKRQEGRIPAYYAALLAAGVRSGKLSEVLGTVTIYARSAADFRAGVLSAMLYPIVVLLLGLGTIILVGWWVLPLFEKVFLDFKMKLPWISEMLIVIGRNSLWILVIPSIVLLVIFATERWWLRSTQAGRRIWTRVVYSLPLFGSVARYVQLATFTDLLSILVEQEIPLPEAIRLAGETTGDPLLSDGTKQIEKLLNQGEPLGTALRQQRLMPDLIVWMIGFGEKQGSLATSLRQIAQMYRRNAEARATLLRTVLPPLLIIILAGTLGFVFVFGLLGPMFELLDGRSGGNMK